MTTDPMPLVLWLGRLRASTIDAATVLADVCGALPEALGVAGAAAVAVDVREPLGVLVASDEESRWLGEAQRRDGRGPLLDALCTGRSATTTDLVRMGPPALAAAAMGSGLVSSLAVPIEVDGERLGALQLLGDARRPVGPEHAELVGPLVRVLAARLADARALKVARTPPSPVMLTALPATARPDTAEPGAVEPRTAPFASVPAASVPAAPVLAASIPGAPVPPAPVPAGSIPAGSIHPASIPVAPIPAALFAASAHTPFPAPAGSPAAAEPLPPRPASDESSVARTAALPIISAGVVARLRRGRHASDTATALQPVVARDRVSPAAG